MQSDYRFSSKAAVRGSANTLVMGADMDDVGRKTRLLVVAVVALVAGWAAAFIGELLHREIGPLAAATWGALLVLLLGLVLYRGRRA
jgi:hypothetical protein